MTNRGKLKQGLAKNPGLINYLSHGSTTILVVLKIAREFRLQMNIAFGTWDYESVKAAASLGPADYQHRVYQRLQLICKINLKLSCKVVYVILAKY